MPAHSFSHVLIVWDLNHHLERDAYENLLEVQGLTDHVTFPTHERGGTLDPVFSDYQEDRLQCHQLGLVGSSDHHVVLIQLDVGVTRDEATTRTIWLWNKADWASLRRDLAHTPWATLLQGGAEKTPRPTQGIRHQIDGSAMVWLYRCCVAAEAKYAAWLRHKRNPTRRNKDLHRAACRRMVVITKWAIKKWEENQRWKLCGPGV
ncbi:hypothetical protein E2C01_068672 [Portunus trituberculatus]|uniref:Endonuclease/exonuclease/phosphatase domain-containing protein n=1 Tax=Portunus trituberculatus TaxID=210409 RepID=A0A5B7HWT1_PORTR|nr:hypothetical protein [Portunus trituberculatus]